MKRGGPKRDWQLARAKCEEGCRVCGDAAEAAHVIGRIHDRKPGVGMTTPSTFVHPDRIVPLCREHHQMYDAHQLDLLSYLALDEQIQAVADAGGIENARIRICGSSVYPKVAA